MLPLQGITVVTLEHAIAAPFCTRQLADLGARVGEPGGAERGRDRLLDRDHGQAAKRQTAAERQTPGRHQNDLGRPSTCSAT